MRKALLLRNHVFARQLWSRQLCSHPHLRPLRTVMDDLAVLQAAADLAWHSMYLSLMYALENGTDDIQQCVNVALGLSYNIAHDITSAVATENAILRALRQCSPPLEDLRKALAQASRDIRDVIVLQVQMQVPITSRRAFIAGLEKAYGGPVEETTCARLMHAHQKKVAVLFPHSFMSKTAQDKPQRRRLPRGKDAAVAASASSSACAAAEVDEERAEEWKENQAEQHDAAAPAELEAASAAALENEQEEQMQEDLGEASAAAAASPSACNMAEVEVEEEKAEEEAGQHDAAAPVEPVPAAPAELEAALAAALGREEEVVVQGDLSEAEELRSLMASSIEDYLYGFCPLEYEVVD